MEVFCLLTHIINSEFPNEIDVFTELSEAKALALSLMLKRLEKFGANKTSSIGYSYYQNFCGCMAINDFNKASASFSRWQEDCLEKKDHIYYVIVDCHLNGAPIVQPEVECKCCRRNVRPTEEICWCCGCKDPGKK
jgi:hypothetical protein